VANYTVTRSCGHEETVALIGKTKDCEWKLEHIEADKLCSECYQVDLQRRRKEANREAAEAAKDNNLPALTGTEKQIPWAESIRIELLSYMDSVAADKRLGHIDTQANMRDAIEHIKAGKTRAHWWIDRRFLVRDSLGVMKLLNAELETIKHEEIMPPKEVVKDILAEATVRPENPKTETVAEIRILDDLLEIRFPEKRDSFRELVKKELNMVWSEGSWKRRIRMKNGTIEDRAAEAGNKLLYAGFSIRIFDAEIRERAINADYKPECTRWISRVVEGKYFGWFVISWSRDENLYRRAKSITGAKYDKPNVVVSPEHFAEVLDFAEMYKFEISSGARDVITRAEEVRNNSIIGIAMEPKEKDYAVVTSRAPVLEIPDDTEVLDEFKD